MNESEYKFKKIIALLISAIPLNFLRILLYRILFKYQISFSSKIGLFTRIVVDEARIENSIIKQFNQFIGPYTLEINDGSYIGNRNTFQCGFWVFKFKDYARKCKIGKNAFINNLHYIDTTGGFELKDNSWIAGRQSEFWTHGAGVVDRSISIGENCYIGSGVKFAPGSLIGKNNLVGLGSVVTKKFNLENTLIAGNPAKVVTENYMWQHRLSSED